MENEITNPASCKTAISSRYGLVKIKHRDTHDRSIFRLWHLLNESEVGSSEYTLCGLATPDSNLTFEDFEAEGYKRGGKITCHDC